MFNRSLYNRDFIKLVVANGFFWGSLNFFLPVLPIYYHSLGMDDHQVGMAIGALSVGSIIFRVYSGKAVDRYGGKPVLTAGMILAVAAIVCYQFSDTIATTTVVRFLHGVGLAGYGAAALTTVTLMHEDCNTTEAVALYTLFTMLGMGASASVATWIFNFGGMQLTIFAAAVSTVLAILLFPRRPALKIKPAVSQPMSTGAVATNPAVYIPTLTLLASNFCFGSIMTFLPLLMLSRGVTEFNSFYVAYAVAVIFSRVWIGRLCARFAPDRLGFYMLALLALTMLAAGEFAAWWVLVLCGVGIGVGYGLTFPVMATFISAKVPAVNRGTAFGFYTMAVDMGFGLGAIGMGAVASAWGYQAVFVATGIYTAVYAVLYQFWLRGKLASPEAG